MAELSNSQLLEVTPEGHARRGIDWFVLTMLLGIAGFLYLNLFALPNIPFLQTGDQIYFWVFAQRMSQGERVYRDFFQFTPPGTDLLYLFFSEDFRSTDMAPKRGKRRARRCLVLGMLWDCSPDHGAQFGTTGDASVPRFDLWRRSQRHSSLVQCARDHVCREGRAARC